MKRRRRATEYSFAHQTMMRRRKGLVFDFTIAKSLDQALNAMAKADKVKRGEMLSELLIRAERENDPGNMLRTKYVRRYAQLTGDGYRALEKLKKRWRPHQSENATGSAVIRRVIAQALNRRVYVPQSVNMGQS